MIRSHLQSVALVAVAGTCCGAIIPLFIHANSSIDVTCGSETVEAGAKPETTNHQRKHLAFLASLDSVEVALDKFLRISPGSDWPAETRRRFDGLRKTVIRSHQRLTSIRSVSSRLSEGSTSKEDDLEFNRLREELFVDLLPRFEEEYRRFMDVTAPAIAAEKERARQEPAKRGQEFEFHQELRRHAEIGQKRYPTRDELREYLILDGRLGVKEGQWSKEDFERFTGMRY